LPYFTNFKEFYVMKKIMGVIFAACLMFTFVDCTSNPATAEGSIPASIQRARRNVPEDALVGIGNAKMATVAMSRATAATRARVEISNTMNTLVMNMFSDYTAASEVDRSAVMAFQENISVTLSRSNLTGSRVVEEDTDPQGNWWVAVYLGKADAVREINQAAAAAKLSVPQAASFNAEERMKDMFEWAKDQGF
jgi:hypothetical protein